jgi:hypothetical protein
LTKVRLTDAEYKYRYYISKKDANALHRKLYHSFKRKGKCAKCWQNPAVKDKTRCQECFDKSKEYRLKNKKYYSDYQKKWRKEHPNYHKEYAKKKR